MKELINETFILPTIMPKLFKGKARPWQSILLYGVSLIGYGYVGIAAWSWENYVGTSSLLSFEGDMLLGVIG